MNFNEAASQPHPGRPRDPLLDELLLRAALDAFLERGYSATTFSEVARRAGVGTTAIYRRWPNKAAMATDVFIRELGESPIPDTGSIREDLIEFMKLRLRQWRAPIFHQVVLPLMMESVADPLVEEAIGGRQVEYRKPLVERIQRAIDAGQLHSEVEPIRLLDLLMGTVAMPLLFNQPLPEESEAESIVDQLLMGLTPRHD
jgi:AcrR family transcriptional regulator